jgi:Spy/CpxP family protein refolding chaperone
MKRFLISAALSTAIVAAGIPAVAQTTNNSPNGTGGATQSDSAKAYGHRGHHGGDMGQRIAQKLNLTQQQQDQLKPIFEKQREQAKAIKQDTSLSADQKKQKFDALRQDTQTQLNSVLTPEQQQQWAQMKAQHQEHKGERGEKMGGARLAEKLNLSQQQQDQLKPIMEKQREQAKAIWQDNSLSQDQKKQKMQALHQDTRTQMNAILTPEQQQQMQQMRQNFKQHRHGQGPASQPQSAPQGA